MFKQVIILFLLLPLSIYGQQEIDPLPKSSNTIWDRCVALDKAGRLDLIRAPIIHYRDYFNIIDSIKSFYVAIDTVYYTDSSFAVGQLILDPNMDFHRRKFGEWTFYYPSGKPYSKGFFLIGAYTSCGAGGPSVVGYHFKAGDWQYWYENGGTMAYGTYKPNTLRVDTNCNFDTLAVTAITNQWKLYDSLGARLVNVDALISAINNSR